MKQMSIRITVAVLTFCFGLAISMTWSISERGFTDCSPVLPARDEQWHRLYEAAVMSGDAAIIKEVNDRLLCTNSSGVPDAFPVEVGATVSCKTVDGSIHELRINDTSKYGSFFNRITASHRSWTMQNLDFVRSISSAERAKGMLLLTNGLQITDAAPFGHQ